MALYEELSVTKLVVGQTPVLLGATLGAPSAGDLSVVHQQSGVLNRSTFVLNGVRVPVTDADASGSFGTLKLFTFPEAAISFLGSRQNYTAFAEGGALTGGAGDAVFEIGLGSAGIASAADGDLGNTTHVDIGAAIEVTLSSGTGVGAAHTGAGAAIDGTTTAASLNLNLSGKAATIDANSFIDVTGTITVLWAHLGDD